MTVQCADIDECELGNACGTGSICTNTDGGYKCSCPTGFNGDPKVACVDVDECLEEGRCSNGVCVNDVGSFRCDCFVGFEGDDDGSCRDKNECLANEVNYGTNFGPICDNYPTTRYI